MYKKIKICFLCILVTVLCINTVQAATKQDIIDYVNSQEVCGDRGLFNTYKSTFTRLLKQKDISESDLDKIYSSLTSSVGILKSKGVCKLSDISKLTENEKSTVMSNLSYGAGLITNAKNYSTSSNLGGDNAKEENATNSKNTNGTKVTINTETNTMDIYEDGVLVDKVSMQTSKMTYTGVNTEYVIYVVCGVLLFIAILIPYISMAKKHTAKTRVIKNLFISLMIVSLGTSIFFVVLGNKLDYLKGMIDLVSFKTQNVEYKVELNEDRTIKKYPSYGAQYAKLSVPSVNIQNNVYFGDTTSLLSIGIGHTTSSDMPTEGGAIIYSSHNRENLLKNLKDIQISEKIVVDTDYAKCTYVVKKIEILKDTETDKLNKIENKETLILYTCYPFDTYVYSDERYVVFATLQETIWK